MRKALKSCTLEFVDLLASFDSALANFKRVAGMLSGESQRRIQRYLKRVEIPIVHADDFGARIHRCIQFDSIVNFDQRSDSEGRRQARDSDASHRRRGSQR